MAQNNNRIKKHKKYYKLRRNRAWVSVLLYLLLLCAFAASAVIFVEMYTFSVINSCIDSDHRRMEQLVQVCSDGGTLDEESFRLLDGAGIDYFAVDKDGKTLHSNGEITCAETGYEYPLISDAEVITSNEHTPENIKTDKTIIYSDTVNAVIYPDDDDSVKIDHQKLKEALPGYFDSDNEDPDTITVKSMEFPIWESVSLDNGQQLVFKGEIRFDISGLVLAASVVIALMVILIVILIAMVIHAIVSAVSQRRIIRLFFTDMKVKGHNWLWFMFRAEHRLRRHSNAARAFALVDIRFVEYRRFCICNSVDEGEELLCGIYTKLQKLIGKRELCAHSAEDSFALLLDNDDDEILKARLGNILTELAEVGEGHSFSFHIGVLPIPALERRGLFSRRTDIDVESEYNKACAARSSLESRDHSDIAFYDEKLIEEQRWEDTVREIQQRAVDNEEFVVFYQPKYDPRTNELRGAEALIRWQSPEYGFMAPYKFIPIFEKNGFITEIDHYMITHVARAQKRWLDQGHRCVPVSVNVSRAHFIESDLAEQIRDIVDREGAPHRLIEIELTESAFFDDKNAMINTICKLKEYGFAVSMDDFGSGYSSLNSLKDMPLDVLKLDAEFFRGEAADTDRGEIVVGEAIKLAKSLNMRTVAEGVEVKEQVDFLASQGCDMIQGYYFAKPMPADDYEERMKAGRSTREQGTPG